MIYIEECKRKYVEFFPVDWIEKLEWKDRDTSLASYKEGFLRINNFEILCFELLSKSALSGEYINNVDRMPLFFDEIKELTAHEYSSPNPSIQSELRDSLYKEYQILDKNLRICSVQYYRLWSFVSNKIDNFDHDFIFNVYTSAGDPSGNRLLSGFIRFVIPLCQEDHMLSFAPNDISGLILRREELKNELEKYSGAVGIIYNALFDKCSFLLKKILHVSGKSEYCFNFKTYQIKKEDIQIDTFNELYERFEFLHGKDFDEAGISEWQHKCLSGSVRISEIVMLMKHYQKDGGTIRQINNLLDDFNKKYNKLYKKVFNKKFNRHALNTTKNYLYNCRLSFKIKHTKYSFEDLCVDMEEIENIQAETGVKNFYPYRKAVIFLFEDIANDISLKLDYNYENSVIPKLELLKKFLSKLEIAIKWCENQHFYPFQLMFNECCIKHSVLNIRLFVPSSFTRPIKYDQLFEELEEYKLKEILFQNKIELLKEREKIEHIKADLAKSERKYIEILGVFTAIITFLFGSINFYSKTEDVTTLISSCLGFGIILLLFSSSIYFLTMPQLKTKKDYWQHPRFLFLGIASILYFAILCWMVWCHLIC